MIQRFRVSSYGKLVGFLCNVFIVSVPIPLFPKFAFIRCDILYRPFFVRVTLLGYPARDSVSTQHE